MSLLVTADCAYRAPQHSHTTLRYHSRHDRSREGREREKVRLGRCACGANDTYGGDKEWRHRDRAVGFVDSAGEATSRSEADGLAQEGAKARAGPELAALVAASRREPGKPG